MSNAFYRFLNRFIPRSTVKAEPINAQFDAVEDGFDTVEGQLSRAVKITGLTNGGEVAKTASTFLQLDSSGNPTASATVPFSPTFSGNRLQSVGEAASATDAAQWGQVVDRINTTAFGSPTVVTLPALEANALKYLRVNPAETDTEWEFPVPVQNNTLAAEILVSKDDVRSWQWVRPNLVDDPVNENGTWTLSASAPLTTFQTLNYDEYRGRWGIATSGTAVTNKAIAQKTIVCPTANQAYSVSCAARLVIGPASIKVECFNASAVSLGSFSLSFQQSSIYKRYANTFTAPATTTTFVVSLNVSTGFTGPLEVADIKLELGSAATPFVEPDVSRRLSLKSGPVTGSDSDLGIATSTINLNSLGGACGTGLVMRAEGTNSNTNGDSRILTYGGTAGTPFAATVEYKAKRHIFSKALGFASVYDNGNTSTAQTIDWYNGQKQKSAITANTTITLTAPDSDIVLDGLRWRGTFSGAGGWTVAFTSTATIRWIGNESPTAANGMVTTAGQELEAVFDWDGTRFVGRWTNM